MHLRRSQGGRGAEGPQASSSGGGQHRQHEPPLEPSGTVALRLSLRTRPHPTRAAVTQPRAPLPLSRPSPPTTPDRQGGEPPGRPEADLAQHFLRGGYLNLQPPFRGGAQPPEAAHTAKAVDTSTTNHRPEEEVQHPGSALPADNPHLDPRHRGRPSPSTNDSIQKIEEDNVTFSPDSEEEDRRPGPTRTAEARDKDPEDPVPGSGAVDSSAEGLAGAPVGSQETPSRQKEAKQVFSPDQQQSIIGGFPHPQDAPECKVRN